MRKTGGEGWGTMHRQRMAFGGFRIANRRQRRYTQGEGGTRQYTQADTPADGLRQAGF